MAFASFFQAEITPEKRKKEGTKCKKDNTPLGENYGARRSKSRAEYSKPTPPFTITRLETPYLRSKSVRGQTSHGARRAVLVEQASYGCFQGVPVVEA
jgi:hypothetical protein